MDAINPAWRKAVPNSVLINPEISVGAKVTYAMFLHYAWQNDLCFPGQARLAKDIGCKQEWVRDFIHELVKFGLVRIQHRGEGKTNVYKLLLHKPNQVTPTI